MNISLNVGDYIFVSCTSGYTWLAKVKQEQGKYIVSIHDDGYTNIKCDAVRLTSRDILDKEILQFKKDITLAIYIPNSRMFTKTNDQLLIQKFINSELKYNCSHYFAMKSDGSYMNCEFCGVNKKDL